MKRIILSLLSGTLFLTACAGTPPQAQPTPDSASNTSTSTPIPTSTQISLPSVTPTASITPLPTIPAFTPTFDASTILTVTSAPKAECPKGDSLVKPNFKFDGKSTDVVQEILNFLNNGGSLETLKSELSNKNQQEIVFGVLKEEDLTNDVVPELILKLSGSVFILHCREHQYENIFADLPELGALFSAVEITILDDLNKNSIPEILVSKNTCADTLCNEVTVFEWNTNSFKSLLIRVIDRDGNTIDNTYQDEITITDFDGNGMLDLVGTNNIPEHPDTFLDCLPCRIRNTVYSWDGNYFVESRYYYNPAPYRFQAIQDADRESNYGILDRSLSLYQDAIFNNQLQPWSPNIALNLRENYFALRGGQPNPTPIIPDPNEFSSLAAYSYYRIMLIQLVQNQEVKASSTYNTLQQEFGNDPYARPYVEMASAFWEAYQSTHKMYDGCAAAIQYAVEHPEILTPLGSDYHGSQSHFYVAADVCPFR